MQRKFQQQEQGLTMQS